MFAEDSVSAPLAPLPSLRLLVHAPVSYAFRGEDISLPAGEYRMSRAANVVRFTGDADVYVMHAKFVPRFRAAGLIDLPSET